MLALVVGGAAAVPAVGFLGQSPRIEAVAPLVLKSADGIGMAVGQDGRTFRILDTLSGKDRAESRLRIGMNRHDEAHPLEPRSDGAITR